MFFGREPNAVLSKLTANERETLLKFSKCGSGGAYDMHALNKLFTMHLLTIGNGRRVVLTPEGRQACDEALKDMRHD